jgi:hypothetical protein
MGDPPGKEETVNDILPIRVFVLAGMGRVVARPEVNVHVKGATVVNV